MTDDTRIRGSMFTQTVMGNTELGLTHTSPAQAGTGCRVRIIIERADVADAAELLTERALEQLSESERFEFAESQMLRWTSEVIRIRPGQELAEVVIVSKALLQEIVATTAVFEEWLSMRQTRPVSMAGEREMFAAVAKLRAVLKP